MVGNLCISEDSVSIERTKRNYNNYIHTSESVKLLDKKYIQAYNDTQGFDHG